MTSMPRLPWRKTSPSTRTIHRGRHSDAPSDLDGLDYALVVGDDEALNAMVATDLSEYFGRDRVFQLPVKDEQTADFYTRVPVLFDESATMTSSWPGSRPAPRSPCRRRRQTAKRTSALALPPTTESRCSS